MSAPISPNIASTSRRKTHVGHSPTHSLFNTAVMLRPKLHQASFKKKKSWHPKNWHFTDEDENGDPVIESNGVHAAAKLFKKRSSLSLQNESITLTVSQKTSNKEVKHTNTDNGNKQSDNKHNLLKESEFKDVNNDKQEKIVSLPVISTSATPPVTPTNLNICQDPKWSLESAIKNRENAEKSRNLAAEAKHQKALELYEVMEGLKTARALELRIREERQTAVKAVLHQNSVPGENSEQVKRATDDLERLETEAKMASQTVLRCDRLLRSQALKNDDILKQHRDRASEYQAKAEADITKALIAAESNIIEFSNSAQTASKLAMKLQKELAIALETERMLKIKASDAEVEANRARQEEQTLANMRVSSYLADWDNMVSPVVGMSESPVMSTPFNSPFTTTPRVSHIEETDSVGKKGGVSDAGARVDCQASLVDQVNNRRRSSITNILEDKLIIWENQFNTEPMEHLQRQSMEDGKQPIMGQLNSGQQRLPPMLHNHSSNASSITLGNGDSMRDSMHERDGSNCTPAYDPPSPDSMLNSANDGMALHPSHIGHQGTMNLFNNAACGNNSSAGEASIVSVLTSDTKRGSQENIGKEEGKKEGKQNHEKEIKKNRIKEDWEKKVHGELEHQESEVMDDSDHYDKEGHLVHHASNYRRGSVQNVITDGLEAWEVRERSKSQTWSQAPILEVSDTRMFNYDAKTGYYQLMFSELKLGIGLHAAIDRRELPIVTAVLVPGSAEKIEENDEQRAHVADDLGTNKPFGDRLCKVGDVELMGEEDTYVKAIELIRSADRPLMLGFVPLHIISSLQSELDMEATASEGIGFGSVNHSPSVSPKLATKPIAEKSRYLASQDSLTPEPFGPPPEDLVPVEVKEAATKIQNMFRIGRSRDGCYASSNSSATSTSALTSDNAGSGPKDNRRASAMAELFDNGLESWEDMDKETCPHVQQANAKRKSHEEILGLYAKHGKDEYLHDINIHDKVNVVVETTVADKQNSQMNVKSSSNPHGTSKETGNSLIQNNDDSKSDVKKKESGHVVCQDGNSSVDPLKSLQNSPPKSRNQSERIAQSSPPSSTIPRQLDTVERERRIRSDMKANAREWLKSTTSTPLRTGSSDEVSFIPCSPLLV